jgi:adenylate kinase family enzyme
VVRIVTLGCAGSGKTTLARQLGERTGVPVICLDAIWQPHWEEKDVLPFRAFVKKAHAGDEWISDGNFALATFDIRLPRATLVIWLNRSRLSCAWRAVTGTFKRRESHRIARLPDVLAFIWKFDRVNRPRTGNFSTKCHALARRSAYLIYAIPMEAWDAHSSARYSNYSESDT